MNIFCNERLTSIKRSTDENVTFESKNKPDEIITYFKNMYAGLSKKESPSTHFKVVQGVCGASGTVSFESVAKPAYFLSVKKGSSKIYLLLFSHNIDSRNNACFYPRYDKYFKVRKLFVNIFLSLFDGVNYLLFNLANLD